MTVGLLSFGHAPASNPFILNIKFDGSTLTDVNTKAGIQAMADNIASHITNPITVNILVGIGTVTDGLITATAPASNAGATVISSNTISTGGGWTGLRNGLDAALTTTSGRSFFSAIPTSEPSPGSFVTSGGGAKALGLKAARDTSNDAIIALGSDFLTGGSAFPDLQGIFLHECTHALGRVGVFPQIAGCFSSAGVHNWFSMSGYLSVDNGTTNVATWEVTDNSFGNTGNQQHNDALRVSYTPGSVFNTITAEDLIAITTLGYNVV